MANYSDGKPNRPLDYAHISSDDLLRRVREIVRGRWCQGSNALNADGLPANPMSNEACQWCARGAAIKALNASPRTLSVDLHNEQSEINKFIAATFGFKTNALFVQWNDTQGRTEQEVLNLIAERLGEPIYVEDAPSVEGVVPPAEETRTGDVEGGTKPAARSISRGRNRAAERRKRAI